MIFFDIEGTIIHIFERNQFSAKHNEFETFSKQEIIVETEDDVFTLTFNDNKVELLNECKVGSKIKAEGKFRGHIWKKNDVTYSKNEMRCLKLKIFTAEFELNYQNQKYLIKRYYYDGYLRLKLVSKLDNSEIDFSAVGAYENDKTDHILFSNSNDKELLNVLVENGIVEHLYDIHQYQAASGHICKVLVMDKFKNDILYK